MTTTTEERAYCVLMDISRWDPDEGRAWITVTAADSLDAMDRVKAMYPAAAVLRAEVAA
jgi:hypothetical protein